MNLMLLNKETGKLASRIVRSLISIVFLTAAFHADAAHAQTKRDRINNYIGKLEKRAKSEVDSSSSKKSSEETNV